MDRYLVVLGVLFVGLCLMLMPQIHLAAVQANELYALGLRPDLPAEIAPARSPTPGWFSPVSPGAGGLCIATGLLLGWKVVAGRREHAG